MRCTNCGESIDAGADRCAACGHRAGPPSLELASVVGAALKTGLSEPHVFFGVTLLCTLPGVGTAVMFEAMAAGHLGASASIAALVALWILDVFAQGFGGAIVTHRALAAMRGETVPPLVTSVRRAAACLPSAAYVSFVRWLGVGLGCLCCVIPGVFAYAYSATSLAYVVDVGARGGVAARRAQRAGDGRVLEFLGVGLMLGLTYVGLVLPIVCCLGVPLSLVVGDAATQPDAMQAMRAMPAFAIAQSIGSAISQMLILTLDPLMGASAYLRLERGSLDDPDELAEVFS